MKYMGSKLRLSKYILPIILKGRKPKQYYVEPFVGGCNTIDKVSNRRIAGDNNKYLIALWVELQKNWVGDYVSRELFVNGRNQFNTGIGNFTDYELGWIGFMGGFNGRFFGGGYSGKHKNRDYVDEQIRNTLKQVDKIKGVKFYTSSYSDLVIPPNSIIYCDIPYKNVKQYDTKNPFDYDSFYSWCDMMKAEGHSIFVSEYSMPDNFKLIFSKDVNVSIRPSKPLKRVERLYTL